MQRKQRKTSGSKKTSAALNEMLSAVSRPVELQRAVFPPCLRRTLRYSDNVNLSSSSGAVAQQQYRINAAFDPDNTGTGHQPRGFDQLCSSNGPYTKYRVLKVRAAIEAVTVASSEDVSILAAGFSATSSIPSLPSGSGTSNVGGQGELPGWKVGCVPPAGAPARKFAWESDVARIANVRPSAVLSEDNWAAVYNARPAEAVYFTVQMNTAHSATADVNVLFKFELDVQFEDPLLLASS